MSLPSADAQVSGAPGLPAAEPPTGAVRVGLGCWVGSSPIQRGASGRKRSRPPAVKDTVLLQCPTKREDPVMLQPSQSREHTLQGISLQNRSGHIADSLSLANCCADFPALQKIFLPALHHKDL